LVKAKAGTVIVRYWNTQLEIAERLQYALT